MASSERDTKTRPVQDAKTVETIEAVDDMEFAKALKVLQDIVKSLESGELSLEDSLARFEEGIRLARHLESILDRAERRVQEILNPAS